MNNSIKINIVSFLLFVSIIFSYIISEDTLGGAKIDFYQYEDIIYLFSEDLLNTLKNYSSFGYTRNSPVFFIILSYLYKLGLELDLECLERIVSFDEFGPIIPLPYRAAVRLWEIESKIHQT